MFLDSTSCSIVVADFFKDKPILVLLEMEKLKLIMLIDIYQIIRNF